MGSTHLCTSGFSDGAWHGNESNWEAFIEEGAPGLGPEVKVDLRKGEELQRFGKRQICQ